MRGLDWFVITLGRYEATGREPRIFFDITNQKMCHYESTRMWKRKADLQFRKKPQITTFIRKYRCRWSLFVSPDWFGLPADFPFFDKGIGTAVRPVSTVSDSSSFWWHRPLSPGCPQSRPAKTRAHGSPFRHRLNTNKFSESQNDGFYERFWKG